MSQPALTIGITTFNRRAMLEAVAKSLAQVDRLEQAQLWVLDDCSQEFDVAFLQRLFPQATVLRAGQNSGGADYAMHRLFRHFVENGSGYLLNLDADLLASRRLVDRCLRIIEASRACPGPRLVSLFNAASHPTIGTDGEFLIKRSVGAAGTLWEHGLLADVLRHVPASRKFDWDWSAYLTRRGVPIRVTPRSYVQHIGRVGQNSRSFTGMDHGEQFDDYEGENLAAFLDHTREGLLQMIAEQKVRIDNQGKAIAQISQVVQSQAQLINALIGAIPPDRAAA
ncbi:MAG TPA: glycosyltransferase [Burkholderiaceae bacterium]|jgi:glycosyltransferase involved in cell wall biosynthesis|nr:glycosyltransferase [Burkholderiaceae bacterium]